MKIYRRALSLSCGVACIAAPALAQTPATAAGQPAGQSVENVVVTAQKRSQKVQNVPIGITVINGQQLQRQQIQTVQDLSQSAASLEFAPTSNAPGGGATVRGIGTETFQAGAQASVGLVLDGVPLGNLNTNNLFDIARVEVLRGPQGMLFGSSVSGGVINITTNAPDPSRYYAIVHADLAPTSFGDYKNVSNYVWNGVANLPISENSAVRISAFGNYLDGLYHDNYTKKGSADTDQGVRVHYLIRPTEDLTINILGDYEKINNLGYQLFAPVGGYPTASAFGNPSEAALLQACGVHQSLKNNQDCSNYPNAALTTNRGASLQVDYNTPFGTITNIASFRDQGSGPNAQDILGVGPGNIPEIFRPLLSTYQRQISEELRLASPAGHTLEYTAGFFFNHYDGYNEGQPLHVLLPFGPLLNATNDHSTIDAKAVFGQMTYHVLPGLRLIAGGRLQTESIDDVGEATSSTLNFVPFPLITTTTRPVSGHGTVDNASWRVGAEYDIRADTHAYFTVTRGYKGPQVSDGIAGQPATIIAPEIPTDFELGVKTALFHDRLAVDFNLFHDSVKDFQGQTCLFPNGVLQCTPSSVPHVLTQGIELDVFGRPIPPLTVNASVLYNDARYPSGYIGSDGSNLGHASLVNATRFKFTLNGEYDWELANGQEIYLDDTTVYKSDVRLYPAAGKEFLFNAHFILGAKLGWRLPGRGWGVAIFVKNALDAHEPVQIYPNNPGDNFVLSSNSTRLVGVSLDAKF